MVRNSFATLFRGKIVDTETGSAIVGCFSKFYFTVIFF